MSVMIAGRYRPHSSTDTLYVRCGKLGVRAGQRIIHRLPDLGQLVIGRDAIFKIKMSEHRSAFVIHPAQRPPRM